MPADLPDYTNSVAQPQILLDGPRNIPANSVTDYSVAVPRGVHAIVVLVKNTGMAGSFGSFTVQGSVSGELYVNQPQQPVPGGGTILFAANWMTAVDPVALVEFVTSLANQTATVWVVGILDQAVQVVEGQGGGNVIVVRPTVKIVPFNLTLAVGTASGDLSGGIRVLRRMFLTVDTGTAAAVIWALSNAALTANYLLEIIRWPSGGSSGHMSFDFDDVPVASLAFQLLTGSTSSTNFYGAFIGA